MILRHQQLFVKYIIWGTLLLKDYYPKKKVGLSTFYFLMFFGSLAETFFGG